MPERGEHEVDVALERASTLRVRVVDRETGAPIPGAELAESERGPALAACDENGFADLYTAVGEVLSVVARAPDHVPIAWTCEVREVPSPAEGAAATFPLALAPWAEGRVLTDDGTPVADAHVRAKCEEHRLRIFFSEERRKQLGLYGVSGDRVGALYARTAETGAFRVCLPPCGDPITLTASVEGRPDATAGPFEPPQPGGALHADIFVREGGGVRGRVTRGGEPSEGEVVALAPDGERLARTFCSDDGRYELPAIRPGPICLELRSFPFGKALASAELVVEPGAVIEHDLEWSADVAEIRGRVLAPDGTPLAEVDVSASASDSAASTRYAWSRTAEDGSFALAVDGGVLYKITATHGPATDRREDVRAGDAPLEFVLPGTGTVVLRLVDALTGTAVGSLAPSTSWHVAWAASGDFLYRIADASLDVAGRLAFDVEAGRVDVRVHLAGNGYERALVRGVAVPEDGESEEVVVRLEPGAEARISLDGDGPLRDHAVFALEEGQLGLVEGPLPDQQLPGTVDLDGICVRLADPLLLNQCLIRRLGGVHVLRGLAPGRYRLRAFPDDVVFEPEVFDVPAAAGAPIELRWRAR